MGKGGYYLTQLSSALAFFDQLGNEEVDDYDTESKLMASHSALVGVIANPLAEPQNDSRSPSAIIEPATESNLEPQAESQSSAPFGQPAVIELL